jgi:hypothetical protein
MVIEPATTEPETGESNLTADTGFATVTIIDGLKVTFLVV